MEESAGSEENCCPFPYFLPATEHDSHLCKFNFVPHTKLSFEICLLHEVTGWREPYLSATLINHYYPAQNGEVLWSKYESYEISN